MRLMKLKKNVSRENVLKPSYSRFKGWNNGHVKNAITQPSGRALGVNSYSAGVEEEEDAGGPREALTLRVDFSFFSNHWCWGAFLDFDAQRAAPARGAIFRRSGARLHLSVFETASNVPPKSNKCAQV